MLPDYIIYDELQKEREDHQGPDRPRVEIPKDPPPEFDEPEQQSEEDDDQDDRGVTIIEM